MGVVIGILSGKGGTGKSTVCAGIATALAQEGVKVLCIDCDIGLRNLDISLGIADLDAPSFLNFMEETAAPYHFATHPDYPSLSFLTAPVHVQAEEIDSLQFDAAIRRAKECFDYIFLDAPAGVDAGFRLVSTTAQRFILVTAAGPSAVRDAGRVAELLELQGKPDVKLIVNRVDKSLLKGSHITIDDVMDHSGLPLLGIVPEEPAVTLAAAFGKPLLKYAGRSGAGRAFYAIAKRVQGYPIPLTLR